MFAFPKSLQELIAELANLPSIGEKSATRLAYHFVVNDPRLAESTAAALLKAVRSVKLCEQCFFLTEEQRCRVCRDTSRDPSLLCVIEKPVDLVSIERVGEFRGYYHVLHGLWAPLRGQGPESMKLKELLERLKQGQIKEVILATGSTVEGDATALYIARLVHDLGIRTSRLAQGVPKGGELEYLDDVTLSRAFMGRTSIGD